MNNLRNLYGWVKRRKYPVLTGIALITALTAASFLKDIKPEQQIQQQVGRFSIENIVNSSYQDLTINQDSGAIHGTSMPNQDIKVYTPKVKYPKEAYKNGVRAHVYFGVGIKDSKPINPRIKGIYIFAPNSLNLSSEDSTYYKRLFEEAALEAISDSSSYIKTDKDSVIIPFYFNNR